MGTQYMVHCPQCGYDATLTLGVGFVYPEDFAELQENGKCGKFGNEVKDFFVEHPDGVIDSELVIAKCDNCSEYYSAPLIQMYVPKQSRTLREIIDTIMSAAMPFRKPQIVSTLDLENYRLYKTFLSPCEQCGESMKMFLEKNIGKLACPHCGNRFLIPEIYALWD